MAPPILSKATMAEMAKQHYQETPRQQRYPFLVDRLIKRRIDRLLRHSLKDGRQAATMDSKPFLNNLYDTFRRLHNAKIDCILKHAEHLVLAHMQSHPHTIVSTAIKLLRNIAEHTDVELTANKMDADVIRSSLNEIGLAFASARKVSVVDDNSLLSGSIVIKAHKSIVDAQVKTMLNKAKELIQSRFGELDNGRTH